jgi:enoyl-CoA hydratase/carnithine racemase
MSSKLVVQGEGAIRSLLLNKPAQLNALDQEVLHEIEHCWSLWEAEPDVAVVILGSTSPKTFCVGADIERLAELNATTMQHWERLGSQVLGRIESSRLISIASIPGYALGGGLTLALSCDLRVCATTATFGQPEIDLGWIPGWGGVARLARAVGIPRAKELCLTGQRIPAEVAERLGLVNKVCPPEALEKETNEMAQAIARQNPTALRATKAACNAQAQPAGPLAPEFDAFANSYLLPGERGQAAISEFLKRRKKAK